MISRLVPTFNGFPSPKMSFTSNEINYLIWRYLRESGFEHTAFVFGHESELNDCSITSSDLPSGSLVSIVQRGLFYIDAEVKAYNNELPTESGDESPCKMSLIDGAVYLSRILNDTSDSSVVPPPSPSDSGRPEVETAASTSSVGGKSFLIRR
ncbi:hypothetical protein Y032_0007g3430 [Ancylostoma ceylanicum]|uniref:Uncharacterized protein n=2 Tax=Ancylostoma ceylanicum TaxID=53326 RepID=A0A016VP17_9BILA|nr:hypothetical protein Y032_0007g3430 [Ancylostoma ceylanicum]